MQVLPWSALQTWSKSAQPPDKSTQWMLF